MSKIRLKNVCKIYQKGQYAVSDFNLEIEDKEFIIFVGPSGCGKSTTLRMIAGLEEISDGELWIDDKLCNYVEPKDRDLSMVFQNYALYPNMTVYGNMAFALKIRKIPKKEIKEQVEKVAKLLEIEHLLDRYPKALSGGQRQRVAIGSAIIRNPKAFLMDEPLSNLDAKLRAQMRIELSKLHEELGTTIIYVTHDQTEAMTLGTRIVVMKDGIVQQIDTPATLYRNPCNLFVAGFIGSPSMNFFRGMVGMQREDVCIYFGEAKNEKKILIQGPRAGLLRSKYLGKEVVLGIRPEDIYDYPEAMRKKLELKGSEVEEVVTGREMLGAEVILYMGEKPNAFSARLTPDNQNQISEIVKLYFDMDSLHIFDADTEENIFYEEEH